ncbi:MAG: hypothetical protein RL514_4229 [Verrucomicrobiota bacterium]|jgi:hypothetical protein
MRCPLICLGLAVAIVCLARPADVRAQTAKAAPAPVLPHYDPPDQPFRMAPMPQSTRSIVVPLATNLHLAFDTALLRTHTVWSGKGLALLGPQYGLPKSPFISTNGGTVLWTMPPVFPWTVGKFPTGKLPHRDDANLPDGWMLRRLSRPDVSEPMSIGYSFQSAKNDDLVISEYVARAVDTNMGVSRTVLFQGRKDDLWFLAHAEMGHGQTIFNPPAAVMIARTNDVLLVSLLRQEPGVELHIMEKHVDYEVETVTEQGVEKGNPKHRVTGHQVRVFVHVSESAKTQGFFALQSEVFPTEEAARQSLTARRMASPTSPYLRSGIAPIWPPVRLTGSPIPKPSLVSTPHYRAEAFPLPQAANLLVTGMVFMDNGDLAICTWPGEVWVVEGAQGPTGGANYRRVARGLCEPMGLVSKGKSGLFAGTKQGLYRLDFSSSSGALFCENQAWGYTGSYNAFIYGPVLDNEDNFILANAGHSGRWDSRYMGWAVRIANGGREITPICSGLREPNGIGTFGPDREVFVTENQGQWMAACKLNQVTPGKFYGHPSASPAPQAEYGKHTRFDPPAVWFPYKLARSVTGFAEITDDRFGPFKGQLMVGDFQNSIVTRVQLEKVNGEYQGAVWPFLKQFQSGVNRLVFGPDGKLYVGGLQAPVSWKAVAPLDYALERISYTGKLPFEVKEVHAQRDGFELTFTQPVEAKTAADPESYDVTQYGYKYHAKYGSPELDHDGKENAATVIKVAGATVSSDKLKVRLQLSGWKPGYVTMVRSLDVKNGAGESLVNDTFWYTLNQIPK